MKKRDSDGYVARYKSRLVVCGNEQRWGVDFDKTFTEVMDTAMFHVMAALSLTWNSDLIHGDVPNAYVKAEAENGYDLYMVQPKGRVNTPGKVLKL